MVSKIFSAVIHGIDAGIVTIETAISGGLPATYITGLADKTVNEAAMRTRAAMSSSGLDYPLGRVTVNIAPAGSRKRGSQLDLPMAIGILSASGKIFTGETDKYCIIGELSLNGDVRGVSGVLPMAFEAAKMGLKLILPEANVNEARLVKGLTIVPVRTLSETVDILNMKVDIPEVSPYNPDELMKAVRNNDLNSDEIFSAESSTPDFSDIRGMETAKRALTVAAAGGHGVMMVGSPATGKTMLAERIPGILPEMTYDELIENTRIYSVAGLLVEENSLSSERPFRNPSPSSTKAGLLGGGLYPKPGELTLANGGVLFMDEFAEFDRNVIDSLRGPLEKGFVSMVRSGETYVFPAHFLFVAASNPCKCGYHGDPRRGCVCSPGEVGRYRARISGPIRDRIDIFLRLYSTPYEEFKGSRTLSTADMKAMVLKAREMQKERYGNLKTLNSNAGTRTSEDFVPIDSLGGKVLKEAYDSLSLNPRTYDKTCRVARTIADIEGLTDVSEECVLEALSYRDNEESGGGV